MYLYLNLLIHTFKSFLLFAFVSFKHNLKTIHLYFGNTFIAVYWYMITMAIVFLYFCKTIWQHFSHISHIKQTRQILVRSFKKKHTPAFNDVNVNVLYSLSSPCVLDLKLSWNLDSSCNGFIIQQCITNSICPSLDGGM